jgi:hypothetical protein
MPSHSIASHYAVRNPVAAPPSSARISAAVARISRHFARANDSLGSVFGDGTSATNALRERVRALESAEPLDVDVCAARLHDLAVWLSAVAEAIELDDVAAATLRVDLGVIVSECEMIAGRRIAA